MTAPVWIRGILADEHGVPVDSVTYVTRRTGRAGPRREAGARLCRRASACARIGPDQTLSAMLASGEIDALYTARAPSSFRAGDGRVRRLFEDFPAVERDYFRRTRIFPIMHTVVIRRDVYERAPLDRAVALQGVRRGAAGGLRGPRATPPRSRPCCRG